MSKINPKKHDHSPNFRRMYPERVEKIYEHIKNLGKDKGARTSYFTGLDLVKSFKTYCIEKKYADPEATGLLFLPAYSDYATGVNIKKEYDAYVSERVKDITADLKSIF